MNWIDILVTPLLAALVGFAVWYLQSRIATIRREQERLHDDRRKVYTDILDPFIRALTGIKNPRETQKALQQMLSHEYKRTSFQLSLIGGDDVVRSFNDFMQYLYSMGMETQQQLDPVKWMNLWGVFLLQIRKNVGNPDTKLTPADMLRSQIKDIDKIIGGGA